MLFLLQVSYYLNQIHICLKQTACVAHKQIKKLFSYIISFVSFFFNVINNTLLPVNKPSISGDNLLTTDVKKRQLQEKS